ncbi:hypothetical protein CPAR01_05489 [Colletotrichum paranaense]|uniref:Uncharacterized protein n=2 Tax=Colletotrichum acutatum species complex TaxID=2707335 RepID=A0ABQ9QDH0_9PEZI|nr:uncharacterized protein CPAR01_05489 [Colletotrichum paranaense]KAK0381875.1 hypothetical protein CLIM01_00774 [Colletotrichum limetticola]KAK1542102.1 hypothetical protein CPAR01_05489 [Colletotrichum paranaense]
MASICRRHIFPLFVATTTTFGGLLALFNPAGSIRAFGLPDSIASSPTAHATFSLSSARTSVIGLLIYTFYARGDFGAIDTVLLTSGLYCGIVDGYVCYKEGEPVKALLRILSSWAVGLYGGLGITSVSHVTHVNSMFEAAVDYGILHPQG